MSTGQDTTRLVLLETKGLHLGGEDTAYKQSLLASLGGAYRDERWHHVGSLELDGGSAVDVVCDLVFDKGWQGTLATHYFSGA